MFETTTAITPQKQCYTPTVTEPVSFSRLPQK